MIHKQIKECQEWFIIPKSEDNTYQIIMGDNSHGGMGQCAVSKSDDASEIRDQQSQYIFLQDIQGPHAAYSTKWTFLAPQQSLAELNKYIQQGLAKIGQDMEKKLRTEL